MAHMKKQVKAEDIARVLIAEPNPNKYGYS
jgi:hypothetical protein